MSKRKSKLDQLNVSKPCSADWDQMTGNDQKRFCSECNKHVFDFSQMTRQQIEAVTAVHQGNLCARITRREDGSMVMLNVPPAYSSRRLNLPMLSATIAAALALNAPAAHQPVTVEQGQVVAQSKHQQKNKGGEAEAGTTSSVNGTVIDSQGAVVANAVVKLVAANAELLMTRSSAEGAFQFTGLAAGTYSLMVESSGFKTSVLTDVRVSAGTEIPVSVTLEPNAEATIGIVLSAPATLLSLHQESELIAIVTVGKSKVAKVEEGSKQLQTALHISSVLKGNANQRLVPFYHWVSEDNADELKIGGQLLVFLDQRRSEEGKPTDGFEANDWSRSIRKLDDAELGIYRQRIEELNTILAADPPNQHELIEWLVRCIEEPATRWDGAYDLEQSLDSLKTLGSKAECEDKAQPASQPVAAEVIKEIETAKAQITDEAEAEEEDEVDEDEAKLSSLLSKEQKARVASALFSIESLSPEDFQLVELVMSWNDTRLAPYLASQLQKIAADAPVMAENLVSALAEVIDDKQIQAAADDYRTNVEYDASEYQPDEEAETAKKPKTIAAQIAVSKRSAKLVAFLSAVYQKLNR